MAQRLTASRILLVLENLFYATGAFVADFNETHVYNPSWPPHARFHNGMRIHALPDVTNLNVTTLID